MVEKVIDSVDGCSRPTWVGITFAMPDENREQLNKRTGRPFFKSFAQIIDQKEVEFVAKGLRDSEARTTVLRKNEIRKMLQRIQKKREAEIKKQVTREIELTLQ